MSDAKAEGSVSEEPKQIADTSMSIDRVSLGSYFNVNIDEPKIAEKIDLIAEWAQKNTGKDDPANLLWAVSQLAEEMGIPPMGMDRLTQFYNWIKIDNQINSLQKEKKAFEKNV